MARQIPGKNEAHAVEPRQVKNISGAALSAGDVVMWSLDGTADHVAGFTVELATVAGEDRICGVVIGRTLDDSDADIPDDATGYIAISGLVDSVPTEVAATAGDALVVSGVNDGEVAPEGTASAGTRVLGVALIDDASSVIEEVSLRGLA